MEPADSSATHASTVLVKARATIADLNEELEEERNLTRKAHALVEEKEIELRFLTDEYQKLKGLSRSQAQALSDAQNRQP